MPDLTGVCETCKMPDGALGPDGEVWHENGICPGPVELRSKDGEHCDDCGGRIEGGHALGVIFCDTCTKSSEFTALAGDDERGPDA